MPIQVICPGCHVRFSVADQHGGKQGPCPKCKELITIPKPEEEIVVHAPDHSEAGSVGVGGRHALKTYGRKETKFKPLWFAGIAGAVLATVFLAILMRSGDSTPAGWILALGAISLGPPLAWAGYTFLRDAELEAYSGSSLWIRAVVCGLVFALLWGVYLFVGEQLFGDKDFSTPLVLETWQTLTLAAGVAAIGTFAAFVAFDLEPTVGVVHFALYFGTTILLRLLLGLAALPGLGAGG